MKKFVAFLIVVLVFAIYYGAYSYNIFGGRATRVIGCHNNFIYADVGPPRPMALLWAPGYTKTYAYGPPRHAGQWMLGLYFPYTYCLVSKQPIITFPGFIIIMMGSSQ